MKTEYLKKLIDKAIKAGLEWPKPAPWIVGTELEQQYFMWRVSTKESVKKEIIDFFNSEPSLEVLNNKMFNSGTGWTRITYEQLVSWLLYTASKKSIEEAVSDLDWYLKLDCTPAIEILAISGIDVKERIPITSSITLIPFSEVPSSLAKEALDPVLLRPDSIARLGLIPTPNLQNALHPPKAAIIKKVKLSPKSVNSGDDIMSHIQPQNLDLYEACESLTLIGRCSPLPVAHWHALEERVPCARTLGGGWSALVHDIINPSTYSVTSTQAPYIRSLSERFLKLPTAVREKLRVPIQRLNQARRRQNVADKAIDLGVSFEALYLGDRSHKEQISFTFRLRGSWHIGKEKEERQNLISIFNKIYECRSKAVHTGKLDEKIKIKNRGRVETRKFLEEADDLCVRSIMKIIDFGEFPSWDEIILGDI